MRQNSSEPEYNMITLEEYLKRRQAIKNKDSFYRKKRGNAAASALELADLLYV